MNSDPELCRRVAEACGLTQQPEYGVLFWYDGKELWKSVEAFQPDWMWEDAMWAAERFGLLDDELSMGRVHTNEDGWEWMVFDPDDDAICITHAHGPTAICHAIVRLADA